MNDEIDGHIHVMPTGGLNPVHAENSHCWCQPELHYRDEFTLKEVWVHREIQ